MKWIMMFFVFLTLAGCAADQLERVKLNLQKQGQPPEYIDGYVNGCDSGYSSAGNPYFKFAKNVGRFAADKIYKQGWVDGYDVCKTRYQSIPGPGYYR